MAVEMKQHLTQLARSSRASYLRLENRPVVIVVAAAGATVGVVLVLASDAGWPHVMRLVQAGHSWAWLAVCFVGELIAYGGYVLTVRAVARVDGGNAVGLRVSITEVIAGFGVFAATRTSGGFAAD